jgi:hypothetical protein
MAYNISLSEEIMAVSYDKEFLVDVYMSKYIRSDVIDIDSLVVLEENAIKFYDKVGKEEFRKWASVTAEAIREYRALI